MNQQPQTNQTAYQWYFVLKICAKRTCIQAQTKNHEQTKSSTTFQHTNVFRAIRPGCEMTAEDEASRWHLRITAEQCTQLLNNLHTNFNPKNAAVVDNKS